MASPRSSVVVFHGAGWGKSAAAFGYVLRFRGRGWPVAVVQFMKGSAWNADELTAARELGVDAWTFADGMSWGAGEGPGLATLAQQAWELAADLLRQGSHRLVVLDEIDQVLGQGWVSADEVASTIHRRADDVSVILTGRAVPEVITRRAETITRFELERHPDGSGFLTN